MRWLLVVTASKLATPTRYHQRKMEIGETRVGGMSAFHTGLFGKEAEQDEKARAAQREQFLQSAKVQQQIQQHQQQQQQQQQERLPSSSEGLTAASAKPDTPAAQGWHQPEHTGCVGRQSEKTEQG